LATGAHSEEIKTKKEGGNEMDLNEMCKKAAWAAFNDGIRTEESLKTWIASNCSYRPDTEFFINFIIGCELFDIIARSEGYRSAVDKAYVIAESKTHGKTL
jgi:hypothetical protein